MRNPGDRFEGDRESTSWLDQKHIFDIKQFDGVWFHVPALAENSRLDSLEEPSLKWLNWQAYQERLSDLIGPYWGTYGTMG